MKKNYPWKIIDNAIQNNKLSHAYLFYGEMGVDVDNPVLESIKLILSSLGKKVEDVKAIEDLQYFDLKIISENADGLITKQRVDDCVSSLSESALESNNLKILLIQNVDKGNKHSLNRLLKFVEEPTPNLVIFMTTNHFDKVISTIKSRTQNIFVKKYTIEEKIELISQKYNGKCLNILSHILPNTQTLETFDTKKFEELQDNMLSILEKSYTNKFYLKTEFNKIWEKNNTLNFLNILQFFFLQIQIEIDKKFPLFPNSENLILKYKEKTINFNKLQKIIQETKYSLSFHTNFNIQKSNFLNILESEWKN